MKLSKRIQQCRLSPIRKFYPYATAAQERGIKIYQLNIGQPDIQTPPAYFEAIANFHQEVLAYAPAPGIPVLVEFARTAYITHVPLAIAAVGCAVLTVLFWICGLILDSSARTARKQYELFVYELYDRDRG